jgi:hypothetical protein
MSDFITGLRGDLVDAADRHRRRGRRRSTPLRRVWQPALAGATAVAAAIAVLFAADTLSPDVATRPEIAAVVQIGGQPQDAVAAGGSLWVSDFGGRVIRVDPVTGRATARIDVPGNPIGIAAAGGDVWVTSPSTTANGNGSLLSRIDSRTGRVIDRIRVGGYVDAIAAGAGGLWLIDKHRPRLERIDPVSGARTARVPFGRAGALAIGGETTLWALGDEGTVVAVDGGSLAVDRLRGVSDGHGPAENMLAADAEGAWVVARGSGALLRIESGRLVSRTEVPEAAGPVAVGDRAVWVATGDAHTLRGPFRLAHIDPDSGEVTATLDLGRRQPKALLAAGRDVWVIAADGTALLVKPRAD